MTGFPTLLYKEVLRFWKVSFQTVAAPVLTTLLRGGGTSQTFTGVPGDEHLVTVTNGRIPLRGILIEVTGRHFGGGLEPQGTRTFDIGSALRPGDRNTVGLTGLGPRGSSADVLIWDGAQILDWHRSLSPASGPAG